MTEPSGPSSEVASVDPAVLFPAAAGLATRDGNVLAPTFTNLITWDADGRITRSTPLEGAERVGEWALRGETLVLAGRDRYTWLALSASDGAQLGSAGLENNAPDPGNSTAPRSRYLHPWHIATDGKHVAAPIGGEVHVFTVAGEPLAKFTPEDSGPSKNGRTWVHYLRSGDLVVGSAEQPTPTQFWEPDGSALKGVLGDATPSPQWFVEADRAQRFVVAQYQQGGTDMPWAVYDSETLERVGGAILPDVASAVALSPDGRTIASSGGFGSPTDKRRIHLVDTISGQTTKMSRDDHTPQALAFADDGRTLYSHNARTGIVAWDLASRRPVRDFELPG